jgi:hypothetical protein
METAIAGMPRNHVSDLRGVSRLAVDATTGVTALVEAMHAGIGALPPARLAYRSIQGVTRTVGRGIDGVLARLAPVLGHMPSSPAREAVIAALNGVLGDHLVDTGNPLAIGMQWRHGGSPLPLTPDALRKAVPDASARIAVLVHGLCMNDLQWTRHGHDHGAALARALGYTPVHLHYNTGLHVSTNGRMLAGMLERLLAAWPVPVEALAIVGHSMGGLVARSAHHYGALAGHGWSRRLRALVFLGTPHHGAALERGGHHLQRFVARLPYVGPLAHLGRIRSAGITDLRHGNLLDEDWRGCDRFAHGDDRRRPVALPRDVNCFALAATTAREPTDRRSRLLGDGFVPLSSALGHHPDPRFALAFPEGHRWIACATNHFGLLGSPVVYERVGAWLAR